MNDIKDVVAKNIFLLRKKLKLTQVGLAEKVCYSDKAISRWEKGESMPDIETLNNLSVALKVPITFFFEEHTDADEDVLQDREKRKKLQILITILAVALVWMMATVIFFYLLEKMVFWQAFVWAVPVSLLTLAYCNKKWGHPKYSILIYSFFLWTAIVSVYCQNLDRNMWLVFLLGLPIQTILAINQLLKPIKSKKSDTKEPVIANDADDVINK